MAAPWGLIVLVIGILYGWLTPGRQNKFYLLRVGFFVGVVLALVFAAIGLAVGANPIGLGVDALGLILSVIVLTLLFVVGAWVGDLIEGPRRRTA